MIDIWIAGLLGLAIGVWRVRSVREEARLLVARSSPPALVLARGALLRLVPVVFLGAALLVSSPAALAAAAGGLWLGRTVQLVVDLGLARRRQTR